MSRRLTTCRSMCISSHARAIGYITNQPEAPPLDFTRSHMAQTICDRPECRRRAEREVLAFTGEAGTFCHFVTWADR